MPELFFVPDFGFVYAILYVPLLVLVLVDFLFVLFVVVSCQKAIYQKVTKNLIYHAAQEIEGV